MPNRILKESICTSETIDGLTPEVEVLFYRLITQCDDYGRLDARPVVVRARCFPLRIDKIKNEQISKWLNKLEDNQLIHLYKVDGKTYLEITTWKDHQQVRANKSKYPDPPIISNNLQSIDSNRNQLKSDSLVIESVSDNVNDKRYTKPIKSPYGELSNVLLTPEEYERLKIRFNGEADERINRLSTYIGSRGDKYKSHYATILSWASKEKPVVFEQKPPKTYPLGEDPENPGW